MQLHFNLTFVTECRTDLLWSIYRPLAEELEVDVSEAPAGTPATGCISLIRTVLVQSFSNSKNWDTLQQLDKYFPAILSEDLLPTSCDCQGIL